MHGKAGDPVFRHRQYSFTDIIIVRDPAYGLKDQRMVGQYQVRPFLYRQVHHRGGGVQRDQHPADRTVCPPCLQTGIIPVHGVFRRAEFIQIIKKFC